MDLDDDVCLCFHVSKRKIVNFCRRRKPSVPSLISECLAAGTGCGWCIPFLKLLHEQAAKGNPNPDLYLTPQQYAALRCKYHKSGQRPGIADHAKRGTVNEIHPSD